MFEDLAGWLPVGSAGQRCGLLLLGEGQVKVQRKDTVPGRPHHTDGEACVTESTGHCGGRGRTPGRRGSCGWTFYIPASHLPWMGCSPLQPQWPYLLLLRGEIGTMGLGIRPTLSLDNGKQIS